MSRNPVPRESTATSPDTAPTADATALDCICCGERRWSELYAGIIACGSCGYQRISQVLTLADLEKIYSREYFKGDKYQDYEADRAIIQTNFRARLRSIRRYAARSGKPLAERSLFEIGSAYGFFLDVARPDVGAVRGIDITVDATRYARETLKLDVLTGDVLQADLPTGTFDIVCMWDTIEHLNAPELYLKRAWDLLVPGGLLFASTGDVGSLMARIQKRKWRHYDPPVHVHYFSRRSLAGLFQRMGFTVLGTESCAFIHSVEGIVHGLGMYAGREPGVLGRICRWLHPRLPRVLGRIEFPIDLGDIFLLVGQKPAR